MGMGPDFIKYEDASYLRIAVEYISAWLYVFSTTDDPDLNFAWSMIDTAVVVMCAAPAIVTSAVLFHRYCAAPQVDIEHIHVPNDDVEMQVLGNDLSAEDLDI